MKRFDSRELMHAVLASSHYEHGDPEPDDGARGVPGLIKNQNLERSYQRAPLEPIFRPVAQ